MVEDRKTKLAPQLIEAGLEHERLASGFIEWNNSELAEQEYRKALSERLQAQGKTIRYHKGGLCHQIGYCLFLQRNNDEAKKYFLYAFIEDCITLDSFPEMPAFKNLYSVYQISYQDLRALFRKVRADYEQAIPLAPEDYLAEYLKLGNTIESVAVTRDTKVFVGGNYRNIALLRHVEDTVREAGLSPIMPLNFQASEAEIYMHAMRLLKDCGSAIFEITFDAGHLMEIERAMGFIERKNILLLYQQTQKDERHYTRMLWSTEVVQEGYMHIRDLTESVNKFIETTKQKGPTSR
jgi:tetratricopeptide (TPR) repeat protein